MTENTITIPTTPGHMGGGLRNTVPVGAAVKLLSWIVKDITAASISDKVSKDVGKFIEQFDEKIGERGGRGGFLIEIPIYEFPVPDSPLILRGQGIYTIGWGLSPKDAGARYLELDHIRAGTPEHSKVSSQAHFLWVKKKESSFEIQLLDHKSTWNAAVEENKIRRLEVDLLEQEWSDTPLQAATKSLSLVEKELSSSKLSKAQQVQAHAIAARAAQAKADVKRAEAAVENARIKAKRAAGISTLLTLIQGAEIVGEFLDNENSPIDKSKAEESSSIQRETYESNSTDLRATRVKLDGVILEFGFIKNLDSGAYKYIENIYESTGNKESGLP